MGPPPGAYRDSGANLQISTLKYEVHSTKCQNLIKLGNQVIWQSMIEQLGRKLDNDSSCELFHERFSSDDWKSSTSWYGKESKDCG